MIEERMATRNAGDVGSAAQYPCSGLCSGTFAYQSASFISQSEGVGAERDTRRCLLADPKALCWEPGTRGLLGGRDAA